MNFWCVYSLGTRGNESLSPYQKRKYSRSDVEIAFREDLCGEMKTKLCVIYGNRCSLALLVLGVIFRISSSFWSLARPTFLLFMICLIRELGLLNYLDNQCHNAVESNRNSKFTRFFLLSNSVRYSWFKWIIMKPTNFWWDTARKDLLLFIYT